MNDTTSAQSLSDQLLEEPTFSQLIQDSHALVLAEVKKKNMAMRTGFNMIQKAKPDLVDRALVALMPSFVRALEPLYTEARQAGTPFGAYLKAHDDEAADALLHVSDSRVQDVDNRVIKSGYQRLRGRAHKEVVASIPGLADLMDKHVR